MPLQETTGNSSADGYGGAATGTAAVPNYIEDVFSTYLYTGNGSTQTITNGIDLAGKGGLVWMKNRAANSAYTESHGLFDTLRGPYYGLNSNGTAASTNYADMGVSAFNTTGFDTKNRANPGAGWNNTNITFASWTFRKQAKFFDIVTYTGNGTGARAISHNLGSTPGFVVIKRTDTTGDWIVSPVAITNPGTGYYPTLKLNTTDAVDTTSNQIQNSSATTVTLGPRGAGDPPLNVTGGTYVMYLYASNAGGFGLTGTDNVISCGSITLDGSNYTTVDLGYEPQWVLIKNATTTSSSAWEICDNMRGMPATSGENYLLANSSAAEGTGGYNLVRPTSTGFSANSCAGTYIYIAIRRGPMKVPTDATKVFAPNFAYTNNYRAYLGKVTDASIQGYRSGNSLNTLWASRLTGPAYLVSSSTAAEVGTGGGTWDNMVGNNYVSTSPITTVIDYAFARAPSFMDEVCYTGDGVLTGRQVNHNLGVAPELIILKARSNVTNWTCYAAPLTASGRLLLNSNAAVNTTTPALYWGNGTNTVAPTSTVFTLGSDATAINQSGSTYVAYLFATCAGVSKVGSYTGTDATQTINCGFSGGARFVLIKKTNGTGNWYVWDSTRGMVSGTDPSLRLNSILAEQNSDDVYAIAGGFQLVSAAGEINGLGDTYIYLAIA